jgi:hypothetical protein
MASSANSIALLAPSNRHCCPNPYFSLRERRVSVFCSGNVGDRAVIEMQFCSQKEEFLIAVLI